jgi:hypothetical protein
LQKINTQVSITAGADVLKRPGCGDVQSPVGRGAVGLSGSLQVTPSS